MYIVDIIPLAFIPRNQAQILSYFYKEPLKRGTVVEVALGRRKIKGIVVTSNNIKSRKLDFKKGVDFSLKNIGKVVSPEPQVADWQLEIARWMSSYYYAPLGICLKTVLPPFFGKKSYKLSAVSYKQNIKHPPSHKASEGQGQIPNTKYLKTNLKNHYLDYKKDIGKMLKSNKQIFLLVPENIAGRYFTEKYKNYNPVYISSGLSNKEHYEIWRDVQSGKAKLVIGTRVGLFLPFKKLGLIIADDESNEFYKSDMMPRYDGVELAEFVARLRGAEIIKSAVFPKIETNYGLSRNPGFEKAYGLKLGVGVVNMVGEIKAGNFSIFSRELKGAILDNVESGKNTILYIPRRGYSNFIFCEKCGNSIKCPNCEVSLVAHESIANSISNTRELQCHHCRHKEPMPKLCKKCGSYKLKPYGIGIEKVEAELKKLFQYQNLGIPPVFRLDSDSTKNDDKKEKEIIGKFTASKGAVLLATQIIFSHKYYLGRVPLIGIINADTLIRIPDFRAEESLFRQIYTLGGSTAKLIIQTHNPDTPAIQCAAAGNAKGFIKQELENRLTFNYPPFSQLVKLTYRHKNPAKARDEARILYEKLTLVVGREELDVALAGPSPAFISRERGLYVWNIIIKSKVNPSATVGTPTQSRRGSEKLKVRGEEMKMRNELLRIVPAGWLVEVDPARII